MKFLCDRCQTRYSIGDDRVRGKILKVRCKNCANVITVREGMPDPDAEPAPATPDAPRRPQKTTTAAPAIQSEAAAPGSPGGVLGAAFASAMARPAPALEAEWYVSIEGEQAGPFSLAEARRWVAAQPIDADLHCWSEGFD
ncbi:MAG TPA: GYF domain-containing protein, partial [Kofleriaceae bacterium]|nr:GYF domain-containing protein [Kofleriaceae bacterium]